MSKKAEGDERGNNQGKTRCERGEEAKARRAPRRKEEWESKEGEGRGERERESAGCSNVVSKQWWVGTNACRPVIANIHTHVPL